MKDRQLQIVAYGISVTAVLLAFVAWGQGNAWQLSETSTYQLFPLFGLLAFSLMWSHYIAAALRLYVGLDKAVLAKYFEFTSLAVLAAILLHPGLLAWQLWRDGLGLPPGSELQYLPSDMRFYVMLGMVSLTVFLAYEFRRVFGKKTWWKFVQYGSDIAMFMIFIHAVNIGGQIQTGWFQTVWYFYGVTLLSALTYIYYDKHKQAQQTNTPTP